MRGRISRVSLTQAGCSVLNEDGQDLLRMLLHAGETCVPPPFPRPGTLVIKSDRWNSMSLAPRENAQNLSSCCLARSKSPDSHRERRPGFGRKSRQRRSAGVVRGPADRATAAADAILSRGCRPSAGFKPGVRSSRCASLFEQAPCRDRATRPSEQAQCHSPGSGSKSRIGELGCLKIEHLRGTYLLLLQMEWKHG
jgi:hypothetical protein